MLAAVLAPTARAQSIPGAVLAHREPHHHLTYEDSTIRVLRVRVAPHDTTLLHEHDPDYFWISLGASTLVNARPGAPDATVTSADLAIHYAAGHFAHVARNPGESPFDNITVELLEPQGTVRNGCEPAVAGQPLDCPSGGATGTLTGGAERLAFSTARLRVSLVAIPAGSTLRSTGVASRVWVIALDTLDAGRQLRLDGGATWVGGVATGERGRRWGVRNVGSGGVKVLVVRG